LILGLVFIDRLSVDLDEPFSIFHAQKNLNELSKLFVEENNPPLHFYLLHFWIKLFGTSSFSVRSLSLIFSVATLPLLFFVGKKIKHDYLGLLLMLLFTFSNFHHSYGIEARAYPFFSFLFTAILFYLLRFRVEMTLRNSLIIGFLCALLFYAHYMSILVIPVIFLIHLLLSLRRKSLKQYGYFVFMVTLFTVLLLPFLNVFMERLSHVQESGTWVEKPHWTLLYGMLNKFMNGPLVLVSLVSILVISLVFRKIEISKPKIASWDSPIYLIAAITLSIYCLAFLISSLTNSSVFLDRYMFFLSIGWITLLSYVVLDLHHKGLKIMFLPIIIYVLGFNPLRTHNRESDTLVAYAKSFKGSYIITPPHYDLTFLYHGEKDLFQKLKEGKKLFEYGIFPIHGLHEVDLENMKKPVVLIDAGAEFLYGERKLLEDLTMRLNLSERRKFKGGYEVLIFN
jgi:mannosyltransferase